MRCTQLFFVVIALFGFSTVSQADFVQPEVNYSTPMEVLNRIQTPVDGFSNPGCLMFQIRRGDHVLKASAGFSIDSISMSHVPATDESRAKTRVEFGYLHVGGQAVTTDVFYCIEKLISDEG